MPHKRHPSRKKFTRFTSKLPFQFGLPNVSPALAQTSDSSPIYFTRTTSLLRQQVLANASGVKIKSDAFQPQVLPRNTWSKLDFSQSAILFLIPDDALGDCVGIALFFKALKLRYPKVKIGVLNSGSASDIFALIPDIEVFQLFISSKQFAGFDHLVDLSEMEGWQGIATMPVNPEKALCEAFGIDLCPLGTRNVAIKPKMKIGIVPMASSPLRTLPPALIQGISELLSQNDADITILLNAYQGVMKAYKAALGSFSAKNIQVLDGFRTIGELVRFVEQQDYVVVADSGPAHITKLFQTPGLGIYSSASAATLQGRHVNLRNWQSGFAGPYCTAPCGLAKVRMNKAGNVGCMGSLKVTFDALGDVPSQSDKTVATRLIIDEPVPCVQQLLEDQNDIISILADDLQISL